MEIFGKMFDIYFVWYVILDERRGPRDNNRRDNYNNRDKRDFNRDYQR